MQTILNFVILYMLIGLLVDVICVLLMVADILLYVGKTQNLNQLLSGELKIKILTKFKDLSVRERVSELVIWPVYQPMHYARFHKALWSIDE